MIISIVRTNDDGKRTIGKLFIDGKFQCFTLEDTFRDPKIKHKTRIPAGSYKLDTRHSPKFTPKYKHNMIWVKDVPQFEFVLFHKGNTEEDTSGCISVGTTVFNKEMITGSKLAYDDFYDKVIDDVKNGKAVLNVIDFDRS